MDFYRPPRPPRPAVSPYFSARAPRHPALFDVPVAARGAVGFAVVLAGAAQSVVGLAVVLTVGVLAVASEPANRFSDLMKTHVG